MCPRTVEAHVGDAFVDVCLGGVGVEGEDVACVVQVSMRTIESVLANFS